MSWGRFKLSEIANIIMGQSPESKFFNLSGEGIPFMQGKTEFGEIYPTISKYTTKTTRIASENSILFTVRAPVGSLNIANQEICIGRGLAAINSNDGNNSFLYYLLKNNTKILLSQSGEGVYDSINKTNLLNVELFIPLQIEKRNKIGHILSAYDDLIENNLKRIKLLEQAVQNIYKEWFVNMRFPGHENTPIDQETGLPEGWENDIIENQIAKVKRKKKLKKDDYLEKGKIPIIDQAKGLIAGYTNNLDVVQDDPLPLIVFGDHTRRVKYINFPFASGADGTQLLTPINKKMLPAYFYLAINSIDLSDYKYARHFKYLKQQFIIIPNDEILDLFNKIAEPFLNSCIQLLSFNKKLKSARDILLPRLMNQTIEL